jgi:hypothetical protein
MVEKVLNIEQNLNKKSFKPKQKIYRGVWVLSWLFLEMLP